jgi:hypothetical protein
VGKRASQRKRRQKILILEVLKNEEEFGERKLQCGVRLRILVSVNCMFSMQGAAASSIPSQRKLHTLFDELSSLLSSPLSPLSRHFGEDYTAKQIEERIKQLQLHLTLSPDDPDETYEQSLKYVSESAPLNSTLPWEATSSSENPVDGGADVAENEDEKWRRVREVTKAKKSSSRKLVKGRKVERKKDDSSSEEEFGDTEENLSSLPSASLPLRDSIPFPSSVLLDSDDE